MFFKEKVPVQPPIENEHDYIAWFIRYGNEVSHIRHLYKKSLDKFVVACTKGAEKVLAEYPDGDSLFERIGEFSEAYETQLKPLVEARGGLEFCPPELQGSVAGLLMNTYVGIEFLKKKHKHRVALELFETIK